MKRFPTILLSLLPQKFTPSLITLFIFVFLICYRKLQLRYTQNTLAFNSTSQRSVEIITKMKHLLHSYRPPWWMCTGIFQTLFPEFLSSPSHLPFRREEIHLPEMKKRENSTCCPELIPEGIVSLDWLDHPSKDEVNSPPSPVILLIPGLTGSSESGFIQRAADYLWLKGFRVCVYNPRGRGGNRLLSPFLYSAGYTEDLRRVILHLHFSLQQIHPTTSPVIFAAGYSLGSNYLTKYVGEEGSSCLLKGAISLACPIDCISMSLSLQKTFSGQILNPLLVRLVKRVVNEHLSVLQTAPKDLLNIEALENVTSMHEFDGVMVAHSFGFQTASDYYRWSSSGLYLHHIKIPFLLLTARNDPICPGDVIGLDDFDKSPFLIGCVTPEGGHSMDWVDDQMTSWSVRVIGEFVRVVISIEK
jgi:abhydrolase domain-containing protein 1/3